MKFIEFTDKFKGNGDDALIECIQSGYLVIQESIEEHPLVTEFISLHGRLGALYNELSDTVMDHQEDDEYGNYNDSDLANHYGSLTGSLTTQMDTIEDRLKEIESSMVELIEDPSTSGELRSQLQSYIG